jgi:hypothetical protein
MVRWFLTSAVATLALASSLAHADNFGRVTKPNEIVTTEVTPANDVDDYVFEGAPGWQIKASVKKAKTGDLAPILELVAPSGGIEATGSSSSKASNIKKAILVSEGRYALRVRGASGTGGYTLKWSMKPAKGPKVKNEVVAADVTRLYEFACVDGALLSWTLKFKGDGGAQVTRILDAEGGSVEFNDLLVKRSGTSEVAKNIPVSGPGGMWALEVETDFAPVTLSLTVKMALPKVAKATITLNPQEPVLTQIVPSTGGCLTQVSISGTNLGTTPGALFLGPNAVTGASVVGGSTVNFVSTGGSGTVDVVYAHTDGQVSVLENAYTFLPVHVVTGFSPSSGPGNGGQAMTITGNNFRTGVAGLYEVLIGGTKAAQLNIVNANTITCVTPAHVTGQADVELRDACGQKSIATQKYNYAVSPFINLINPSASPTFGGIQVVIAGFNFSVNDTVWLDGVLMDTDPYIINGSVIGHIIPDLPAHAVGSVDIEVRNPAGQSAIETDALAYFDFANATPTSIPNITADDDWGGESLTLVDIDGNLSLDHIVIGHSDKITATRPGVRALKSNGSGVFTDVTSTALPSATSLEAFGSNRVLAGRFDSTSGSDLYLSRPGTGVEAVHAADSRSVIGWGRQFYGNGSLSSSGFAVQPHTGTGSSTIIEGLLVCNATWACAGKTRPGVCYVFDYDFRSVNATIGDLDGDGDSDVILVNNTSINRFVGTSIGTWVSCGGAGVVNYQYYTLYNYGHATRILSTGSNGGLTDRTKLLMEDAPKPDEDFRGVAVALGDASGDFVRDIVIVHDQTMVVNGNSVPATRILRQKNTGSSVTFHQLKSALPAVSGGDDWRGHAVSVADLNNDLKPDLVIAYNGAAPGSSGFSTRILLGDGADAGVRFTDRTATILTGVLPSGDDARAGAIVVRDIDEDGDQDLILATHLSTGTGNRKTRFLLNIGADPVTGFPRFQDASSILPAVGTDDGSAVDVALGDVTGDGSLDIVLVDSFDDGNSGKRLRIFKQVR